LIDCARKVKCLIYQHVKPRTARAELFGDADFGSCRDDVEELEEFQSVNGAVQPHELGETR